MFNPLWLNPVCKQAKKSPAKSYAKNINDLIPEVAPIKQ